MTSDSVDSSGAPRNLSRWRALVWILCLAALAVGARNFETGLTSDSPLYASIARNIARSGEWFRLYGNLPEFVPFREHPHLGFWVMAAVFKCLPAADWSVRIPSHLFYVAFLFSLFLFARWKCGEKTAVATILMLWIWYRFSNIFSGAMLDPGAVTTGAGAVFLTDYSLTTGQRRTAPVAGLLLALCVLYKGMFAAIFFLVLGVVFLSHIREWRRTITYYATALVPVVILVALYVFAVAHSHDPDYLRYYWSRQFDHRFAHIWTIGGIFDPDFWSGLVRDTIYLAPLALLSLLHPRRLAHELLIPAVFFVSSVLLLAPSGLHQAQYWAVVLPWVAWLASDAIFGRLTWHPSRLVKFSTYVAIAGVFLLQYLPFPTHSSWVPIESADMHILRAQDGVKRLYLDRYPYNLDFIWAGKYAWNMDTPIDYVQRNKERIDPIPSADPSHAYLFLGVDAERSREIHQRNWCLVEQFPASSLWRDCQSPAE